MPTTATITTARREPPVFAVGTNLLFERRLPDYPASQGWQLTYQLRGGAQAIQFQSAADGDFHLVDVPAATTALWQAGDYLMTGTAINAAGNAAANIDAGEAHQIFYGDIQFTASLAGTPGNLPVTTHYQRMVTMLQAVAEGKAGHDILTSKIEGTVIERMTPEQFTYFYEKYYRLRQNEIDGERAANGQPSRNRIKPIFSIVPLGPSPYREPNSPIPFP
jgi:hypothetical protein